MMKFVSEVQIQSSTFFFYSSWRPKQSQLEALTFYLFIYLFIYVVVYVTDHRCFSSQGDLRLAYPWLWWSSFEVLSNFVVVIYYITIWKWVNSNKLFFFYKVLVESFSTNLT